MKTPFQTLMSVFLLACVSVFGLQAQSLERGAVTGETAQRINTVFAAWDNRRSPGCALGVSQNGNAIYLRGYGMANLEYGVPITPDSIFNIGSPGLMEQPVATITWPDRNKDFRSTS